MSKALGEKTYAKKHQLLTFVIFSDEGWKCLLFEESKLFDSVKIEKNGNFICRVSMIFSLKNWDAPLTVVLI